MARSFLGAACVALPWILSTGCCFELGSSPSYYMYADTLGPPGPSVVMWPADPAAESFRYQVTSDLGQLSGREPVRVVTWPSDGALDGYLPQGASDVVVLLPAERLEALRPRAQALLDHVVALRPRVTTSVVPLDAAALEVPLEEITDTKQLESSMAHAFHLHEMQRPRGFGDILAALTWIPELILMPLETRRGGGPGESIAVLSGRGFMGESWGRERHVDWEGCVAAIEEVRAAKSSQMVMAWVLEPADASEELRARVDRLMDWIAALEGDVIVWQRVVVEAEVPRGGDCRYALQSVVNGFGSGEAAFERVDVRVSYDPRRFQPNFRGELVRR